MRCCGVKERRCRGQSLIAQPARERAEAKCLSGLPSFQMLQSPFRSKGAHPTLASAAGSGSRLPISATRRGSQPVARRRWTNQVGVMWPVASEACR